MLRLTHNSMTIGNVNFILKTTCYQFYLTLLQQTRKELVITITYLFFKLPNAHHINSR